MPSNPNLITLAQAAAMTALYRANKENILAPKTPENTLPICETFNREAFDALLAQPDCKKVRIYLGMNSDLTINAITVGVNGNDEDIVSDGEDNVIVDQGIRCPTNCPPPSPLN